MAENFEPNIESVDFPFGAARRITGEEVAAAQRAVKEQFGIEIQILGSQGDRVSLCGDGVYGRFIDGSVTSRNFPESPEKQAQ